MQINRQHPLPLRERLAYLFFPRRCGLCGTVVAAQTPLCSLCEKTLPRILPPLCPVCGAEKEACACKGHKHRFVRVVSPFYYEGVARKGLHQLKFQGKQRRAEYLGGMMAQTAKSVYPPQSFHLVTCVPLSPARLRERGYNQSALLTEPVAKALQLPFLPELLVKIHDTPSQRHLQTAQRKANVLGSFAVAPQGEAVLTGKRVLLCDDIVTTGATLDECAKMLLLAGAQSVCCLTGALTRKRIRPADTQLVKR